MLRKATFLERTNDYEKKEKDRQLCKVGICIYSSIFHYIFYFLFDPAGGYSQI